MLNLHVKGGEIKVGDILRFRMSGREPWRMLAVLEVRELPRGTFGVALESGCYDRVLASETRVVRRAWKGVSNAA